MTVPKICGVFGIRIGMIRMNIEFKSGSKEMHQTRLVSSIVTSYHCHQRNIAIFEIITPLPRFKCYTSLRFYVRLDCLDCLSAVACNYNQKNIHISA